MIGYGHIVVCLYPHKHLCLWTLDIR